jgi:hypothetical protein
MSDTKLWCFVEGEDVTFSVPTPWTASISDLKVLIKKSKENTFQRVDASNFKLWKECYFYSSDLF